MKKISFNFYRHPRNLEIGRDYNQRWSSCSRSKTDEKCPLPSVLHCGQHFLASSFNQTSPSLCSVTFTFPLIRSSAKVGQIPSFGSASFLAPDKNTIPLKLLIHQLAPDTDQRSLCQPLMDTNDKRNLLRISRHPVVTQLSISLITLKY